MGKQAVISHASSKGHLKNKELLVENIDEDTIVSPRIVFDTIRVVGMDVG